RPPRQEPYTPRTHHTRRLAEFRSDPTARRPLAPGLRGALRRCRLAFRGAGEDAADGRLQRRAAFGGDCGVAGVGGALHELLRLAKDRGGAVDETLRRLLRAPRGAVEERAGGGELLLDRRRDEVDRARGADRGVHRAACAAARERRGGRRDEGTE